MDLSRVSCSVGGLLHRLASRAQIAERAAQASIRSTRSASHAASRRITPTQEINAQYAAFLADFELVEEAYVQSIVNGSSSTITVSATLTAAYTYPSTQMQVDDAAVFGPNGAFTTPVNASASLGGVPIGATYVITGRSGNTLIINTATSSNSNLVQGGSHRIGPEHQPDECRDDLP